MIEEAIPWALCTTSNLPENAVAADPAQQRALLEVINSIRSQIDTNADTVDDSIGLRLMFGSPAD